MNNIAVNISAQIFLQVPAFNSFGCIPISGISRSYCNSIFHFLRNFQTVTIVAPFYIPTSDAQSSNFSTFSPTLLIFCFKKSNSYTNGCDLLFIFKINFILNNFIFT